jgi:four helix bundle protein
MGVKRLEELRAWQVTRAFKLEVYRLLRGSPDASADFRFRSQLQEAVASGESNIAEGFHRFVAGEFAHFLGFARASIAEAQVRIQDGIDRGYFSALDATECLRLGIDAMALVTALKTSLQPYIARRGNKPRTKTSD